uniref:Uncharacterized protein n=1 Tax=Oryza brachyantha TaxID=4533 RepID=J3M5N3_ORYBR
MHYSFIKSISFEERVSNDSCLSLVHIGCVCFELTSSLLRVTMSTSEKISKPCDAPKTEWPELVGLTIEQAKEKIKADRPDLKVAVFPVGATIPLIFDENRVILWVNTVAEIPTIG